ncbi:PstS family phosphate ABC transporter substrate-binding protein [Pseudanabaena sp. PCC 6802]|uniref:PstS family phosphate ABC transporter substrate-binding protein n=1 Tax=Pseudanabaena sp. PCC 6802 TaxID=118173 RepID=UPI0003462BB0|nr:PstS family phosphate ABC transporter substrate-binding protein [Pseudanabaena sp. PCC 6802]
MALKIFKSRPSIVAATVMMALALVACGDNTATNVGTTTQPAQTGSSPNAATTESLSGSIRIDGSSTVAPISKAVAQEFSKVNSGVKVPVGTSGTGGGFKKFCSGDTDISNASRPIKSKEAEDCAKNKVEFVELPIAVDGLTVVVNKENTWAKCLTVDELKKMWSPDSQGKVNNWKQVKDSFPDEKLSLFGPGPDSGTFDYFTEAVNGKSKASRTDYQPSEDDNILVQGVVGSKGGLGYFGVAYYEANANKLSAVEIDAGKGCVAPTIENINSGKYAPLSRPLFVYVNKKSLERPEVKAFMDFYLAQDEALVRKVGYVTLPNEALPKVKERLKEGKTGTTFSGEHAGKSIAELLAKDLK